MAIARFGINVQIQINNVPGYLNISLSAQLVVDGDCFENLCPSLKQYLQTHHIARSLL